MDTDAMTRPDHEIGATMSRSPQLTVLMPVLNAMPYLPEAVASLQAQTFADFTVLAIDDGSQDESMAYLRSIRDPRFHVLADGRRRGLGGALNLGLAQVTSEFIARMDADDLCAPERFALQVARLHADPTIGAVGTQFTYLGRHGRTGFARRLPLTHQEIDRGLMQGVLTLIHASLMMRASLLRAIGGYRLRGVGEDWDMFLRLAEVTRLANLPEVAYFYRLHDRNASTVQQHLIQERIGYACRCAAARRADRPEPSEGDHRRQLATQGRFAAWARRLDSFSLTQYLTARSLILNGHKVRGYAHLAVSIACGPRRVLARLAEQLRRAAASRLPSRPFLRTIDLKAAIDPRSSRQ
jgi:glycosyltransferase involved in cell wall biosynthesis